MTNEPVDTSHLTALTFPRPAVDVPDEEAVPLDILIQALQLAATDADRKTATGKDGNAWDADTPASMQVIKSGSLAITKVVTKKLATFGGISGALTAIAGVISAFVGGVGIPVTVTLIGSAAVMLSAVAIALALVVHGDLEARGVATAARHEGRAVVAASFLEATGRMPSKTKATDAQPSLVADLLAVMTAYPTTIKVTTKHSPNNPRRIEEVRRNAVDEELSLKLDGGDYVGLDEITGFTTAP